MSKLKTVSLDDCIRTRYPARVRKDLLKKVNDKRRKAKLTWPALTEQLLIEYLNARA